MNAPVLFIAAEPRECKPWVAKWSNVRTPDLPVHWARTGEFQGRPMLAIANGAGGGRAKEAVLAAPLPASVYNIGYCGALDLVLAIGDPFVATEVITAASTHTIGIPITPTTLTGPVFSADSIVVTSAAKSRLRESGALAVEMEAAGAFAAATIRGVAFYCIRTVSDLANEDMGIDFNLFLMPDGRFNIPRLIWHACGNPMKRFGELIRLSRRTSEASNSLGEFLARCTF